MGLVDPVKVAPVSTTVTRYEVIADPFELAPLNEIVALANLI